MKWRLAGQGRRKPFILPLTGQPERIQFPRPVEGPIATQPQKGYIGITTIPESKTVQKVACFSRVFENLIYRLSCFNDDREHNTETGGGIMTPRLVVLFRKTH
jgi:hypothetical protein